MGPKNYELHSVSNFISLEKIVYHDKAMIKRFSSLVESDFVIGFELNDIPSTIKQFIIF